LVQLYVAANEDFLRGRGQLSVFEAVRNHLQMLRQDVFRRRFFLLTKSVFFELFVGLFTLLFRLCEDVFEVTAGDLSDFPPVRQVWLQRVALRSDARVEFVSIWGVVRLRRVWQATI